MSGRKAKVTEQKYLDAVRKKRTDKDITIAEYIGVHRSNISRFKSKYPDVVKKGEKILNEFTSVIFDAKTLTFETFKKIPIISKWEKIQYDRTCTVIVVRGRIRALYNVCRHLNVHPENLTLEQTADLVNISKRAYYNNEKFTRGLAFLTIRKPIRSWFELIHGVSGELLSSMGIHAESSKGSGSASKERVTKEQRKIFDEVMYESVYEVIHNNTSFSQFKGHESNIVLEMKGLTHFMYYTGTRIGSTNPDTQGCFGARLNNSKHVLTGNKWSINLLDKGEKGGLEWDKLLIGDGIVKLKEYISSRFNIDYDDVEAKMKMIDSYMFPIVRTNYHLERIIMRTAIEKAGVVTRNPNHIWRHTFAQDGLHASDWNYELVASIGGWMDTGTLKKHYGKMTDEAKERGLMHMMKLKVEDVTYMLKW